MLGKRIIASKDVTLAEVSEILSKVTEEELGFEQSKTFTYSNNFAKLSKEDADAMGKELMQTDKVSRAKAVKIIDLMPKNADEVKAIFSKETFALSDEEISGITDVVKKYMKISKKEKEEKEEKKEKEPKPKKEKKEKVPKEEKEKEPEKTEKKE